MKKRTFYTVIISILLFDGAILFLFGASRIFVDETKRDNLRGYSYGMFINRAEVMNRCGLALSDGAHPLLLVFIDPSRKYILRELSYIDLLYHKYTPFGLNVVGLLCSDRSESADYYTKRLNLGFPIINDASKTVYKYLNARSDRSGLLLIDNTDTLRLVMPFLPDENNLRQILESFFLGRNTIAYPKEELDAQIKLSDDISGLRLLDPALNKELKLTDITLGRPALITLVDPFCNFCREESIRVRTLNQLARELADSGRIIIVHRTTSQFHETVGFLASQRFVGKNYSTKDGIFAISDYFTDTFRKKNVTSLVVSEKGKVKFVEVFDDDENSLLTKIPLLITSHSN